MAGLLVAVALMSMLVGSITKSSLVRRRLCRSLDAVLPVGQSSVIELWRMERVEHGMREHGMEEAVNYELALRRRGLF